MLDTQHTATGPSGQSELPCVRSLSLIRQKRRRAIRLLQDRSSDLRHWLACMASQTLTETFKTKLAELGQVEAELQQLEAERAQRIADNHERKQARRRPPTEEERMRVYEPWELEGLPVWRVMWLTRFTHPERYAKFRERERQRKNLNRSAPTTEAQVVQKIAEYVGPRTTKR